MLKAIRNNNKIVTPTDDLENKIRISYNHEKCYKCNSASHLIPISNENGCSISHCMTCGVKVLLWNTVDVETYNKKIEETLMFSRMYNPSALKREVANFQKNI